jgi:hypothetical protein
MGVMLEPTNYLADTRPDDIKFLDKVAKKIKSKEENTNSSVPIALSFSKNIAIQQGYPYGFGNFDYPTPVESDLFFGLSGKDLLRMSELPELNLSVVFKILILSISGFQEHPTYTTPIYFNLFIANSIEPNPSGSLYKKIISLPLGNMTWNNATGFTWTDPSQTLNLKNYILNRTYISSAGLYDFSSNNTQITRSQYLELVNSKSTGCLATIVYDPTLLTNSEQDHFNDLFRNASSTSLSTTFTILTSVIFTYIGSLASFTPTIVN